MPVSAATLRKLAALNLSSEQMSGVLDILAESVEADDARRASAAERKRRQRMSRDNRVTVTGQERDSHEDKKVNDTESNLIPLENNLTKNSPPSGVRNARIREAKPSPKDRLATVLKPDLAEAVVEHRRKLRKPLTDHAADLLAKRLAGFPDPNGAAELMIEKGWQSIEPDWVRNLPTPATGPPPPEQPRFETEEEFDAWWAKRCEERTRTAAE